MYHKEHDYSDDGAFCRIPLRVPAGIGNGEAELNNQPLSFYSCRFPDLVTYELLPNVGHFAAYQAPQLLRNSFVNFVTRVEARAKINKGQSAGSSSPSKSEL